MICAFEVTENESVLDGDVEVMKNVSAEEKNETEIEDKKKEDEPVEFEPMEDHDYSVFDAEEVVEQTVEVIEHSIDSSKNESVAIAVSNEELDENLSEKRNEFEQARLSDFVTKKSDPITEDDEDSWGGVRREFIDKDATKCHICDKQFSNRKGMTDHLRRVHKVYSANPREKMRMATTCTTDKESGQKNFECSICDDTFPGRYQMYRHLRDEHGESVSYRIMSVRFDPNFLSFFPFRCYSHRIL